MQKLSVELKNTPKDTPQVFCSVNSELNRDQSLSVASNLKKPKPNQKYSMKRILILLLTVGLFSCNSHLDKTISEPLTVKELKQFIDNDSLFKRTYKDIVYVRDTVLKSDMEKVKFADLTYDQIFEYMKFSADTAYFKPINEIEVKKEWNEKYGFYKEKVDSISNYWKKYKEEHSLESYAKVELAKIDKEYYSYSGDVKNVKLGFRLTPLKGKIDQIQFGYRIEAKINEKKNEDTYLSIISSIHSAFDKSWYLTTSPFSKPVVRYWEANSTNEKTFKNKTLETFNKEYNIYIEIDKIRKDGVNMSNMSNDDLNIPESVTYHWGYENENRECLKNFYVKDIIKEVLGKEYMDELDYQIQEIRKRWEHGDKILKEKDPLVFEFLNSKVQKEDENE
jgi:hypothetical protein